MGQRRKWVGTDADVQWNQTGPAIIDDRGYLGSWRL